jgi:hypothetical protein
MRVSFPSNAIAAGLARMSFSRPLASPHKCTGVTNFCTVRSQV